ncbi:hypothetical protein ACIRSF_12755 [Streptomyces rubiginosohelvolus]|uniref:hypothetical protein n=1 Tax=Streptomyces TaxID=1883 RepID=UPI00211D4881|nr:hypothetical protein [Streptomyces sp. gb14]
MNAWGPASGFWTPGVPLRPRRSPGHLAHPALSSHLACLRDCGLVATSPDGRRTRYELADDVVREPRERTAHRIIAESSSLALAAYVAVDAGREIGSASAVADSKQTLQCTYLSAVLLVGLILNAAFGWSWADPVAAPAIAGIAVKEGRAAWRGKGCRAPTAGSQACAKSPVRQHIH